MSRRRQAVSGHVISTVLQQNGRYSKRIFKWESDVFVFDFS